MKTSFSVSAEWKSKVPSPVFDKEPDLVKLYWKAWELAHDHMLDLPGMPQSPYMDEAFCDTEIWIWDSCFMALFCKYAPDAFPGIETLENFYKPLYGNASFPTIITKNAPDWTGYKIGQKAPVKIHISDNPPLFAWAEYEYAMLTRDTAHLEELLMEKRYLQKHFAWMESLKNPVLLKNVRNESCLINCGDGYFWEGGRSGMDNTPRGREGEHALIDRPNNPKMYWVDAIAQQGLVAMCIARMAKLCDRQELASEWLEKYEAKKALVNKLYWNEEDSCYYDVHADTKKHIKVMTPASYWPLTAMMASKEQAERIAAHIENPKKLGGDVPWASLARDDADFNAETGEYWRGSLWLPTAYAGLKGLRNYGLFKIAQTSAQKILKHMSETFESFSPHTIWECYNPNKPEPAKGCGDHPQTVRKNFCGWSALGPIAIFIEYVIGIHFIDAFAKTVEWQIPNDTSGRLGIKNLRFGGITADLLYENGRCDVKSNGKFVLIVNGVEHKIDVGDNSFATKA